MNFIRLIGSHYNEMVWDTTIIQRKLKFTILISTPFSTSFSTSFCIFLKYFIAVQTFNSRWVLNDYVLTMQTLIFNFSSDIFLVVSWKPQVEREDVGRFPSIQSFFCLNGSFVKFLCFVKWLL